jgi:excisionase family DNA binding protein
VTEWMLEKYGPFMDVTELAEVLKIQRTTLYNQLYADKVDLPYVKRGKKYLFPTTEVVAQMEAALRTQSTEIRG